MLDGAMSIDISRPWARTPSPTALEAGGFLTLTNKAGETDRLIAVDFFSALPPNGWEFGFVDLSGIQGVAFEGIVCAKGVK